MKKTRLLIATLVCTVMLMGIGYAWWNDLLTINGTATTGKMNVYFENDTLNGVKYPKVSGSHYVEPSIVEAEAQKIICSFENLYPGATGKVDFVVINDSDIPVKLDAFEIKVTGDEELKSKVYAIANYCKIDELGNQVEDFGGTTSQVLLEELADELNNCLEETILNPGERLSFGVPEGEEECPDSEDCITLWVDREKAENDTQGQKVEFTLKMAWQQFNQS